MLNHDHDEGDLSPLDLKAFCGECAREFEVTDDTPFGVSVDQKTPCALCSPACVAANVNRLLQPRCSCGAMVSPGEGLSSKPGLIVGCPACKYTGSPAPVYQHLWCHGSPAALCGPLDPSKAIALTTALASVDCPNCLSIMLRAASATSCIRRVPMCPDCQTERERRWATSELDGAAPCARCGKLTVGRTRPFVATPAVSP